MPIEIHCSSDIDDHGEERTRPKKTPHPVVREQDCHYISKPEHLAAMLHLKVFRTSTPAGASRRSFLEEENEQPTPSRNISPPPYKVDKRLLGRELLESQHEARMQALASKKKRRAQAKVSTRTAMASEIKRQEAHLLKVLEAIRCTRDDKERLKATEEDIADRIQQRSDEKMRVSLDRPLDPGRYPQSREQIIEWALMVAAQPDRVVQKELFGLLDQVSKFMVLYGGAERAATTAGRGRNSLEQSRGSKAEFLEMLQNIRQPGEDDHLSLSEKLAKQEARGLARFVVAICPSTSLQAVSGSARVRRTVNRRTIIARFTSRPSQRIGTSIPTIHEGGRHDRGATSPRGGAKAQQRQARPSQLTQRPQSASATSPVSRRSRDESPPRNLVPTPPSTSRRPSSSSMSGGIKFSRASRNLMGHVTPEVEVKPAATVPVTFNSTPNSAPKMRMMSVMSTQINAAGDLEDVIMTKLQRVEGDSGRLEKKVLPSTAEKRDDSDEESDEESIEESIEESVDEGSLNEKEDDKNIYESPRWPRPDSAPALKRYTNNPEYKWDSNDFYSYNDMLGVDEFHEGAVKVYNQNHESREAAIDAQRQLIAETTSETNLALDKLIARFVKHHAVRDSHLAAMVHRLGDKDFHRPDVMARLRKAVSAKVEAGSMHQNVLDELQQLSNLVKYSIHTTRMKHLVKNKWFMKVIHSLHNYKQNAKKATVPATLPRFLLAASTLLVNNEAIDESLFYMLVEKLIAPQDHKDVIVHRSLSMFRTSIGLSAEHFSEYLERRSITACPELLTELQELRRKRDRKLRVQQESREKTGTTATNTLPLATPQCEEELAVRVDGDVAVHNISTRISESAPTSLFASSTSPLGARPCTSQNDSSALPPQQTAPRPPCRGSSVLVRHLGI